MKKAEWGPIIWKTLHCICMKIKDEEFSNEKEELFNMIEHICANLPCPQCASHATGIIRRHKMRNAKSKDDLIKFIFLMHNEVNKRLKKNVYSFKHINKYELLNTKNVLIEYYSMNTKIKYNEKMMLHSFHRTKFLQKFYHYFNQNIDKFNQ